MPILLQETRLQSNSEIMNGGANEGAKVDLGNVYNEFSCKEIRRPLIVADILCVERFFEDILGEEKECILEGMTPSLPLEKQRECLKNLLDRVIQLKSKDPKQLMDSLIFLSTVLLRFDSPETGLLLLNKIRASCVWQPASLPDNFGNTYQPLFDTVKTICRSNGIDAARIKSFLDESYHEFQNEVVACRTVDDIFCLISTYSSVINTVYLTELLEHFKLHHLALHQIQSHDYSVKAFCESVTIQQAADERYNFMPNCCRRYLIVDTVEFRLDLEFKNKKICDALELIKATFPQKFKYVQLRCVSIETYAVSIKCFAPYNLHLHLLEQIDTENFLEQHRHVLNISIGEQKIIEQNLQEEALRAEVKSLHLQLDNHERQKARPKGDSISSDGSYDQTIKRLTDERDRAKESESIQNKVLKGVMRELELQKRMTEDLQKRQHEDKNGGFFNMFRRSNSQARTHSPSPNVSVGNSNEGPNIEIQPTGVPPTSTPLRHPEQSRSDRTDKSCSIPYGCSEQEAESNRSGLVVRGDFDCHAVIDSTSRYAHTAISERNEPHNDP